MRAFTLNCLRHFCATKLQHVSIFLR